MPVKRGNYRELTVNDKNLYYLNTENGDFNQMDYRALPPRTLYAYNFETEKEEVVIDGVDNFKLSADGSSVIYSKGRNIGIISANAKNSKGNNLNLSQLKMEIDPRKEWKSRF